MTKKSNCPKNPLAPILTMRYILLLDNCDIQSCINRYLHTSIKTTRKDDKECHHVLRFWSTLTLEEISARLTVLYSNLNRNFI